MSTHQTVDTSVDDGDLDLSREGLVLTLLEELSETSTTAQQEASGGIEIGTELGEGRDFTVLSEVQLERTSELLHDLAVNVISEQAYYVTITKNGAYVWAAEPTRETERPTLMAGRTPRKKSSASKKI